jgi:hypothetical protein
VCDKLEGLEEFRCPGDGVRALDSGAGENIVWWHVVCRRMGQKSRYSCGGGATLTSIGWGVALMMRSAQQAAVFKSPSGWPARMALTLECSWLDQMLRRKSGLSGTRLLRCLRNWDVLRSPISSVWSRWMHCSFEGDSRLTSLVYSEV